MGILGAEPVTRRQYAAGSWTSGVFAPGSYTTATIQASVQPLDRGEAESLPEGERAANWRKLYSTSELREVNEHDQIAADRVVVDGVVYEVRKAKRYRAVIPHYKALVVRIQEGGS